MKRTHPYFNSHKGKSSNSDTPIPSSETEKVVTSEEVPVRVPHRLNGNSRSNNYVPPIANPNVHNRRQEFVSIEVPNECTNSHSEETSEIETTENFCRRLKRNFVTVLVFFQKIWMAFINWKQRWDLWDPNPNNPIVACINESKLAGLKEAIKPNQGILYRIMWVVLFVAAFGLGIGMSINTYGYYKAHQVLFALESKEINTSDLPSPTVTASDYASFKRHMVDKYLKIYESDPEQSDEAWTESTLARLLYFMKHTCQSYVRWSFLHNFRYENMMDYTDFELQLDKNELKDNGDEELLKKIMPAMKQATRNCSEMLRHCVWNRNATDNCEQFKPTFEATGGSCAFNKIPDSLLYKNEYSFKSLWSRDEERELEKEWGDWSLEKHLRNIHETREGPQLGPKRQADGGFPSGLSFMLTMDESDMECPQFDSSGTRVTISVPGVDADVEKENIVVPPSHEVIAKLHPDVILADDDLRSILPPSRRGCLFENEFNLTYYRTYNQDNCKRECIAEHILKKCKCTILSEPNSAGQTLCNIRRFKCAREAQRELINLQNSNLTDLHCSHCLPSCSSMSIRAEVTSTPYSEAYPPPITEGVGKKTGFLRTYYAEEKVVVKIRKRRYSDYEMIKEIGSIFESTNDVSWLGVARIIVGLTAFFPTVYATWKLLQITCLSYLMLCRKLNIRGFGLRSRLVVNPRNENQRRLVSSIEEPEHAGQKIENFHSQYNNRPTDFSVFLANSS